MAVTLHLYVWQFIQVWGNGCKRYRLTKLWVNLNLSWATLTNKLLNNNNNNKIIIIMLGSSSWQFHKLGFEQNFSDQVTLKIVNFIFQEQSCLQLPPPPPKGSILDWKLVQAIAKQLGRKIDAPRFWMSRCSFSTSALWHRWKTVLSKTNLTGESNAPNFQRSFKLTEAYRQLEERGLWNAFNLSRTSNSQHLSARQQIRALGLLSETASTCQQKAGGHRDGRLLFCAPLVYT